ATVGGTLGVTGALTANGGVSTTTLATSGAATLNSAAVTNNLTVGGATTLTGLLTANGGIRTSTITTTGPVSVGGELNMNSNRITGVADGRLAGDAVNLGQLESTRKDLAGGIASSVAMSNIPNVESGKTFAFGLGVGYFDGESAVAVGASYRVNDSTVLRGSFGGTSDKTAGGVGISVSW
ncbi:MAG: hypothetical protein EBS39_08720, partial [Gammaproteobacteria bacterium]|nr:hypothetical protein [Gammaproteobacteria bacterium]